MRWVGLTLLGLLIAYLSRSVFASIAAVGVAFLFLQPKTFSIFGTDNLESETKRRTKALKAKRRRLGRQSEDPPKDT